MVKIPGLDDLKKMGSDLMDSAKSVKFSEMVDKMKAGMDSVGSRKVPVEVTNNVLKTAFEGMFTTLTELTQAQTAQMVSLKKAEKQLEDLVKMVETYQNPVASPTAAEPNKEEDKPNE
jgi:hypothetical protein